AQPWSDRHAEPLLTAVEDRRRQEAVERPLEDVLRGPPAQLEVGWHATGQLDEVVVQERRPYLEPARHARAVDVHEILVGEIELAVLVDQPLDRVPRSRLRHHPRQVLVRVEPLARRSDRRREEPGLLGRQESAEEELSAQLGAVWEAAEKL